LYGNAVQQMQIVTDLLDPAQAQEDYKRAQKDLEMMREAAQQAAPGAEGGEETEEDTQSSELNLPTPPTATVEPRLELDEDSAPTGTQ